MVAKVINVRLGCLVKIGRWTVIADTGNGGWAPNSPIWTAGVDSDIAFRVGAP